MLESVKTKLRVAGKLTPEVERRILEFERICLMEMRSQVLRSAVLDYLENDCPLEFYTAPASSSGKRHPEWQSLPGGILLNTVECCVGADKKIRMYRSLVSETDEPTDEAHDAVYVATVLSDTYKAADYGRPWREWSHHIRAEQAWETIARRHEIPDPLSQRIGSAIRWHLGRFTPDWPQDKDPRSMSPIDFIVHELDMDFSNRRLSDIFQRRLGEPAEGEPSGFLEKEFDSASGYFQHIEGKLNNLLVFFATLVIAVITACYYVGSNQMFKDFGFSRSPRSFLIALLLLAFTVISLVFVGVYTELRVRKIRMLEEMAAIRGYEIETASRRRSYIRSAITMVASIPECPPYLRRPSEDWYTLLLMTISSASAFAVAIPFLTFGALRAFGVFSIPYRPYIWILEGFVSWVVSAYLEFGWFTRFCYRLDLERNAKYMRGQYVFFAKHGESFPWPLHWLDSVASWIERRHSASQVQVGK